MHARLISIIYAYTVCLISIITFMFALPLGVNGFFKYLNPTTTDGAPQIVSTPFSIWKEDYLLRISESFTEGEEGAHKTMNILRLPVPADSVLQELFQTQRKSELESFQHHLLGPVLQQAFLTVLSLAIFLFHWTWLKRVKASGTA